MKRRALIDDLVRAATGFLGDDRDLLERPTAENQLITTTHLIYDNNHLLGLSSSGRDEITYATAPRWGAVAYRKRLESLPDDRLLREVRLALQQRQIAVDQAASDMQKQKQEAVTQRLRELARRGGAASKRATVIDEACLALKAERPGIPPKVAWSHLLEHGYVSLNGRVTAINVQGTDRLVQTIGDKTKSIIFDTFRRQYWPGRAK